MSFEGKVVIVTGASSGIGAATAIKFSQEGAQVCLVGRNKDKLNNVAKKCKKFLVLIADVSKDEDAERIISYTVKHFGQLDVLVNNAGISKHISILDKNAMALFDEVMATNLRGPVLLTNLAAPYLIKTKGNIVNISSIAATRIATKTSFSYNTSKAGLDHFTRSVALELGASGVRVNTVSPGPVYTDVAINAGVKPELSRALFDSMKPSTALNRISEPEEVADVILFLASDKGKSITGATYVTDNGSLVKGIAASN